MQQPIQMESVLDNRDIPKVMIWIKKIDTKNTQYFMVLYYIYLLLRVIRPTTPLLNLSTLYHCVYRRPFYCL